MPTHSAVATLAVRTPLELISVPTTTPVENEVRILVEWTSSTPLDLHISDGGLLGDPPQVLGANCAGTVIEVGPDVKNLSVDDKVFGYGWREQKEKAHQEFATLPETLLAKVPSGFTLQQVVVVPENFVTAFHAVTEDLGLELPWPRPPNWSPPHEAADILIWGGASSVGQYALQILRYYGYRNVVTAASKLHTKYLETLGAKYVYDYKHPDVMFEFEDDYIGCRVPGIDEDPRNPSPMIPFILDCIGSKEGSLTPIAKLAKKGAKVAVLLPVIVRDATDTVAPEYTMDPWAGLDWEEGVEVRGVRTHFYLQNEFFAKHLQPDIMPALLAEGAVKPNRQKVIEGATLLERAQKALDTLRRKGVSGEKLVWRVAE